MSGSIKKTERRLDDRTGEGRREVWHPLSVCLCGSVCVGGKGMVCVCGVCVRACKYAQVEID